jgi:hypothetical protein
MNEEQTSSSQSKPSEPPLLSGSDMPQTTKDAASTAKTQIETLKSAAKEEGSAALEQIKTYLTTKSRALRLSTGGNRAASAPAQ